MKKTLHICYNVLELRLFSIEPSIFISVRWIIWMDLPVFRMIVWSKPWQCYDWISELTQRLDINQKNINVNHMNNSKNELFDLPVKLEIENWALLWNFEWLHKWKWFMFTSLPSMYVWTHTHLCGFYFQTWFTISNVFCDIFAWQESIAANSQSALWILTA